MRRMSGNKHVPQPFVPVLSDLEDEDGGWGPTGSDDDMTDPDVARVFKDEQVSHGEESGRAHALHELAEHVGLDARLRAGDPDANLEDVNFVGEEAPGGGEPTPDQNSVDDIGRALGLQFQDNEPLDLEGKLKKRDEQRWELDPASAEDYPERIDREHKEGGV